MFLLNIVNPSRSLADRPPANDNGSDCLATIGPVSDSLLSDQGGGASGAAPPPGGIGTGGCMAAPGTAGGNGTAGGAPGSGAAAAARSIEASSRASGNGGDGGKYWGGCSR